MTDQSARARALDPGTSFIVRAPAGSGKTELLIQRYLSLLSRVDAPESILAITFTRKAAGEMRSRVLEAVRAAQGPPPEAPHKRLTWELARAAGAGLLDNPARVRIQTIDSLCAGITRQMPWLARFGALPEITEKAVPLYQEAAQATLLGPEKAETVKTLLLHLDNNFGRSRDLIAQMLEKRDQWLRHLVAPNVRKQVECCLEGIIENTLKRLRVAAAHAGLTGLPAASVDELPAWNSLADDLLTQKDEWRKKSSLAQGLSGDETLLECFKALRRLPPPRFSDSQWGAMEAIVELLPVAAANLGVVFREHATVDFIELNLASLRALSGPDGPTDLGLALGYRIQHILLDEFQDTSYTQFELLERLTASWDPGDGRTLFLVGDPMQSIYRFRQAEVGLFLRAWENGIGGIALEPLTLSVNFRSGSGIVEWINTTFRNIFPGDEDPVYGAVRYSASASSDESRPATVRVHAYLGNDARVEEAERVAAVTIAARESGTVGILVRARSHLPEIIRVFKARDIAYQAIEIDELSRRAVIQDLMALTFALLNPADRISQFAVLRAPWSGQTLEQLLHPVPNPRLAYTQQVLREAVAARGRGTLRDLVEQTWMRLGGPACLVHDSDLADAAAFFDLLETTEQGGDLSDFDLLREQVRSLFAQPDARADGRVQIMTIHKAKGLEFDTVVLPGLGALPKKDDSQLILWHEPSVTELLFAPITESGSEETDPVYRYLSRVEKQKSDYEAVRLLYVAATRARSNLHLLGCAGVRADGSIAPAAGSFLKLLWPVVEQHYPALKPAQAPAVCGQTDRQPRAIHRLTSNWRVPDPPAAVSWTRTTLAVSQPSEVAYEWVGDVLRHVGTAVHTWLARIARDGLERWPVAVVPSHEPAIRTMLANMGVNGDDLDYARDLIVKALRHALTDERGRWLLDSHPDAESELAIAGVCGGEVFEAVIDRTFIDDQGLRWIVDYKTGSHAGGSVEQFLANEKLRYAEQLEGYARLLAQQQERPTRLGLYFPLVPHGWVEWEAPLAVRRQASLFAD